MPSRILSMLELAYPIHCENRDCPRCNGLLNTVFIPADEEESFCEAFGQGGEDADNDICDCNELGVLNSPVPFFFYSIYEKDKNYTLALKMDLDFIETLSRLIKNHQEDRMTHEKVFLAGDAMCNCFDSFRAFEQGEDFKEEFDFDMPSFVERNKVVIVGRNGVCLSVDISTHGDNEYELGTLRTMWFSVEDLAVLNTWIVKRCGSDCREQG